MIMILRRHCFLTPDFYTSTLCIVYVVFDQKARYFESYPGKSGRPNRSTFSFVQSDHWGQGERQKQSKQASVLLKKANNVCFYSTCSFIVPNWTSVSKSLVYWKIISRSIEQLCVACVDPLCQGLFRYKKRTSVQQVAMLCSGHPCRNVHPWLAYHRSSLSHSQSHWFTYRSWWWPASHGWIRSPVWSFCLQNCMVLALLHTVHESSTAAQPANQPQNYSAGPWSILINS